MIRLVRWRLVDESRRVFVVRLAPGLLGLRVRVRYTALERPWRLPEFTPCVYSLVALYGGASWLNILLGDIEQLVRKQWCPCGGPFVMDWGPVVRLGLAPLMAWVILAMLLSRLQLFTLQMAWQAFIVFSAWRREGRR